MGTLIRDLRWAVRTLARAPAFTLVVVGTLALGIGANTAVFSVVDAVLLEKLPYARPDQLVTLWRDATARGGSARAWLDIPTYRDLRDEPRLFEAVATWAGWEPTLTSVEEPVVLRAAEVSHEMFSLVLRVRPELGRDFLAADDVEGAPGVVLLSHRMWRTRFAGDQDVVGRSVSLSEVPYTVVGVMPEGFHPPFAPDAEVWRALGTSPTLRCARGCEGARGLARLAQGVSLAQARAHALALATRLGETYPDTDAGVGLTIVALKDDLTGGSGRALRILLGAVGFVLLLACTNVANLLLARGLGREREMALRVTLGAERGRVLIQVLTESLVLATVGGVMGLGLAAWGTDALLALAPEGAVPRLEGVGMNGHVLAFTAVLAILTGVLFGLLPAWRAARTEAFSRMTVGPRRRMRFGAGATLAATQMALALVLLVGAGLLIRSFQRLNAVDLGFRAEGVLAFQVSLPAERYPDGSSREAFFQTLVRSLSTLHGVVSAGAARSLPLDGDDAEAELRVEGAASVGRNRRRTAWVRPVTEGYSETVGLELIEGRPFGRREYDGARPVVIMNETLAHTAFPDGSAVGRRIALGDGPAPAWRTIVGVARDVRHVGMRVPPRSALYIPYGQAPATTMSVVLKTKADPLTLVGDVRRAVSGLDPRLAAAAIEPLASRVDRALAPDRFAAQLLSTFALVALLLAAVGIYGTATHRVTSRTVEMGVRLTLGAEAADVLRLAVRGALAVAATGIAIGLIMSLALGRLATGFLFEVAPDDPATLAATAVLLSAVALFASWPPARRAANADPAGALRQRE